jgi:hypothetical protein
MKKIQSIRKTIISRKKWGLASPVLILFASLITACAQQPINQITPTAQPPVQPTAMSTNPETTSDKAVVVAKSLLADQFKGVSAVIQLVDIQSVEWPDSCLGVPQAGMMCAMHVVSGYRINLTANGKSYEVHSNLDGSQVLLVPGVVPTSAGLSFTIKNNDQCQTFLFTKNKDSVSGQCYGDLKSAPMVEKIRNDELNHYIENFMSFTTDTPDGFLNFLGNGSIQASAIDQRSIAAWARIVSNEIQAGRSSAAEGMVLSWHREGGLAGFCDDLSVYASGVVNASSCKSGQATDLGQSWLMGDQLNQLYQWTDKFGRFEYAPNDQATADSMTTQLIFMGQGDSPALESDQQTIEAFASQLFANNFGSGSTASAVDPNKVVTDFLNSYKSDETGNSSLKFLSSTLQADIQSGDLLPDLIGIQNTYLSFGIGSVIPVDGTEIVIVKAGLNLVSPIDRYFALIKENGEWKINTFILHSVPAMSPQTEYLAADQVILAYFQAIQNNDSAAGWNLLTPETQKTLTQPDLEKDAAGLQTIQPIKITIDQSQLDRLTYTVNLWINIAKDPVMGWVEGKNTRSFVMSKIDQIWRIDQIVPVN